MDIRDRGIARADRRGAPGRARAPRLRPQPDPRRAHDVRHRRERHRERARRGRGRGRARTCWSHPARPPTARGRTTPSRSRRSTRCAACPRYEYARDKTEIDRLCQLWAAQHPDRTMTIVRPTIVFGPERRQLHRPLLGEPALRRAARRARRGLAVRARGRRGRRDVAAAVRAARRHLQPDRRRHDQDVRGGRDRGHEDAQDAAEALPADRRRDPGSCGCRTSRRRPARSSSCCIRGSPRTRSSRRELGWTPRYTSRETFEITMRAKGLAPPAPDGSEGDVRSGASGGRAGRVVTAAKLGRLPGA